MQDIARYDPAVPDHSPLNATLPAELDRGEVDNFG